ncbi:MAG TPA: hypothetical protein VF466_05490 [Candidatus Saccharimonadales bacterium]
MSEQYAPDPERTLQEVRQLHDAVQAAFADPHDPTVRSAQRDLLEQIIDEACDYQDNTAAQDALRLYGDVVDYLWFEPCDAPLPEALELQDAGVPGQDQWGNTSFGSSVLGDEMWGDLTALLRPFGLDQLLAVRRANFTRNAATLHAALQQFAAATPAGRWLSDISTMKGAPRHLTPRERFVRESMIFGHETSAPRRALGHEVTSAVLRSIPGLSRRIVRQELALDDAPGSLRELADPSSRRLIGVVQQRLAALPEAAGAVSSQYDPQTEKLHLLDRHGRRLTSYELGDTAVRLQGQLFGAYTSFGTDNFSMDVYVAAMRMAYGSPERGAYINALDATAEDYARILLSGFGLQGVGHLHDTLDVVKAPSDAAIAPVSWDEPAAEAIVFRRKVPGLPGTQVFEAEETSEDLRRHDALLRSQAVLPTPGQALEQTYARLLDDLRRLWSLPPDCSPDMVYRQLPYRRNRTDPVVRCLGALCQASNELSQGGALNETTQTMLALSRRYVQDGLAATGRQPHDPQGYTQQKDLLFILDRALTAAFESATEPNR